MDMTSKALQWLTSGTAVFPVNWQDKTPALTSWKWLQKRLPAEAQVRAWMRAARAYAVVSGWNNLAVIDFDRAELYSQWRSWGNLENAQAGKVGAQTYTVKTARGWHVYLRTEKETQGRHWEGVDLQAGGLYVLGERSLHPTGCLYVSPNPDAPIMVVDDVLRLLPSWLKPKAAQEAVPVTYTSPCCVLPNRASIENTALDPDNPMTAAQLLDLAKRAVPVWELLGIAESEIRKTGPHHGMAHCPLHDDAHVSLSVDFERNRVACLAGCTGRHGWSTLDAYMWRTGQRDLMRAAHELTGR